MSEPAGMEQYRDWLTFEASYCELEQFTKVAFKKHITAFQKISHLEIDLELHKNRNNLFVDIALFQDIKVTEKSYHFGHEVRNKCLASLAIAEKSMSDIGQMLKTLGALDLNSRSWWVPYVRW